MSSPNPLASLLREVIQSARAGDLRELALLAEQVDQKISELNLSDEGELLEVRNLAIEASTLLESTLRGLTAARQRIAEVRSVRGGAGIYGGNGQRLQLSIPHRETRRI